METLLLTGPKHSGKTSAGRMLAALSGAVFTDMDEQIERRTGKNPRALYREGPEVFRAAEVETLKELLEDPAGKGPFRVIAAGGGLIDNPAALELVKETPLRVVYLEVSAGTAWERILREAGEKGEMPPFLNTANPRETHRALHERRAAACRKLARFVVSGEHRTPEETAEEIISLLAPGKSPPPPSH